MFEQISPERFRELMQKHIAQISANSSLLRNPGAPGVVAAAQEFLIQYDISSIAGTNADAFRDSLDHATETLTNLFPQDARHWGRARKVINIFLRDSLYNRYLTEHYKLDSIASLLEVPLDGDVAKNLHNYAALKSKRISPWPKIKGLTPTISDEYQSLASQAAESYGIRRADLDLLWWRTRPDKS